MVETRRPASNSRAPLEDWMTIVQFDGKGGVRALPDEEDASFKTPSTGFAP